MADITGKLAATEGSSTARFIGGGILAATGGADVATLIGGGVLAATGGSDTAAFVGGGTMAATDGADTATLIGGGILAATEDPDISAFAGFITLTGDLAATEDSDIAIIASRPPIWPRCHSGEDYAIQYMSLLPTGPAWPREPGSILVNACYGLNNFWGFVDARAGDLLAVESDPRLTTELLPDWERAWGLPDPCFPPAISLAERRTMLVFKITLLGAQSREFFEKVSAWVGYPITIGELAPYMCGISECGDTRNEYDNTGLYRWYLGAEEQRFFWSVNAESAVIDWMRVGYGGGEVGVHHMLEFETKLPIECLLQRWKPAHTEMTFDYSSLVDMGPDVGLP